MNPGRAEAQEDLERSANLRSDLVRKVALERGGTVKNMFLLDFSQ
jgi:hypothetical protein